MKPRYIILALLLGVLVSMTGCEKEYVLEPEPSKLEGINGTFTLSTVTQLDPNTFGELNSLDVTTVFAGSNPATITFNSDARTFTYDTGTTIDFIGASGTWAFDDDQYPTKITMTANAVSYDLALVNTIRPADNLHFQLDRSCGGAVSTSYQYLFTRSN